MALGAAIRRVPSPPFRAKQPSWDFCGALGAEIAVPAAISNQHRKVTGCPKAATGTEASELELDFALKDLAEGADLNRLHGASKVPLAHVGSPHDGCDRMEIARR